MGFFDKIKEGLAKTKKAMANTLDAIFIGGELDDDFYEELTDCLILADLGVNTATKAVAWTVRYWSLNSSSSFCCVNGFGLPKMKIAVKRRCLLRKCRYHFLEAVIRKVTSRLGRLTPPMTQMTIVTMFGRTRGCCHTADAVTRGPRSSFDRHCRHHRHSAAKSSAWPLLLAYDSWRCPAA